MAEIGPVGIPPAENLTGAKLSLRASPDIYAVLLATYPKGLHFAMIERDIPRRTQTEELSKHRDLARRTADSNVRQGIS
jgi:hypothetical protein